MDTNSIRRENLRALAATHKSQADFAAACGTAASVISLIISPNPKRNLGHRLARKIEEAQGLPLGWLDSEHSVPDESPIEVDFLPVALAKKISSYRPVIEIERFNVAGSMGSGSEPPEFNGVVEAMSLDASWVRQNLVFTSVDNIKLISGRGDSMSPTIRSGDPVLVDIGVVSVESDAIYFFQMRGQLHIKRIQRDLDGLTIISDNEKYQSIRVPADREEDLTIMAQVIYWWNGRNF